MLHQHLNLIASHLESTTYEGDERSIYYLRYIFAKIGIYREFHLLDREMDINEETTITTFYYYLKNRQIRLDSVEIFPEDILFQLLYLDVLNDRLFIIEKMNEINIISYKEHDYFPILLNLYVAISLDNQIMTGEQEDAIIAYISTRKNIFGYSGRSSNFDFQTSTYYTNVLNMLNRGESNGLR